MSDKIDNTEGAAVVEVAGKLAMLEQMPGRLSAVQIDLDRGGHVLIEGLALEELRALAGSLFMPVQLRLAIMSADSDKGGA